MGWESPSHWVIIAVVVILLFGYKKLPDASRAIGRSLRMFKTELKGMSEDDKAREEAESGRPAQLDKPAAGGASQPAASSQPAESQPAESQPAESQPAESRPAAAAPPAKQPGSGAE